MSTSPDDVITLLSQWLARHVGDGDLLRGLESVDERTLGPEAAEAVEELIEELRAPSGRGDLEMVARETLESLALGG